MAGELTERTGSDLNKTLEKLIEAIGKTNLTSNSKGGSVSKDQIETEQKMSKILEKRLKNNKAYNDILKKISDNSNKILKTDYEEKKLQEAELKYLKKVEELNGLLENHSRTRTKQHTEQIEKLKDEVTFSLKNLDVLKAEVQLEKEKSKIIDDVASENEKAIKREEASQKSSEKLNNLKKSTGKFLLDQAKSALSIMLDSDDAFSKLSANYSLSKKESGELKKNLGEIMWQTQRIGISGLEIAKLQASYTDNLGRSVMLGKDNVVSMAQTSVALNLGVEAVGQMASDMDLFNIGVKDGMTQMQQLVDISKESGVSATVAAKKFESTLKLSNTYNFKNGVDGVRDMSVFATKMGIKMEQVAAFADHISSPTDAILTASKLQVLGGAFSKIADPLQLMNQGITDMEGLTKTYSKMLDGVVSIDKVTGKMNENGYEKIRAKAAAEAAGLSFDDMMTAARTKAKRGAIEQELTLNTNVKTDADKDLLASLATFQQGSNGKPGGYTVNVKGEQKSITSLKKEDLQYLKPDTVQVKDIAENTLGIREILENNFKALLSTISGDLLPIINNLAKVLLSVFGKIADFISPGVTKGMNISAGIGNNIGLPKIGGGVMGATGGAISLAKYFGVGGQTLNKIGGVGSVIGGAASGISEYNKTKDLGRSLAVGGGSAIGGLAGAALGQVLIPIPGVGAFVGGLAGSMIGEAVGRYASGGSQEYINDGFISKEGKVTKINDNDSVIALKPGGPLDKIGISPSLNQGIFKGVSPSYAGSGNYSNNGSNNNQPFKLDVSGTITLNVPGGKSASVDASELIKNPIFIRQLARKIDWVNNRDSNGGKYSGSLGNNSF